MQQHAAASLAVGATQPLARQAELRLGAAEWALLVLHSMLWGSAFFFVDVAKADLPVFTINALRLVPAVVILLAVVTLKGLSLRPLLPNWRAFLLLAVFNNALPFILIIHAQATVTGGLAAVFIATTPMFSLIIASLITGDERITANKVAGIGLGVCGVAVLTGGSISDGGLLAKLALVMAALCYALAGAFTRTLRGSPPMVIATGQMLTSLLISAPLALSIDQPWTLAAPNPAAIAAVLASGVFGSALAAICYFTLIGRAGATNALLVTLLIPLTPITLGAAVLGQRLAANELTGALVIAASLLLIDGRVLTRLHLRRPNKRPGTP